MPTLSPKAISALLSQVGLVDAIARSTLVAIALAESGGQLDRAAGPRRGLWMIDDSYGYDRRMMVADGAYAAAKAVLISRGGLDFGPWPTWRDGRYRSHLNAARQAEAQAASVSGSILDERGTYSIVGTGVRVNVTAEHGGAQATPDPSAGVGGPLQAAYESARPLTGLRVSGTELTSDVAGLAIGEVAYSAGMGEVPNLTFTIADPQGDLLWFQRNLWVRGARVQYLDLDLRIDEIEFSPGGHTTGQLEITAIDALVYALMNLRGNRVQSNVSPNNFVRREVQLAGYNPDLYFLGESLPTQTEIARDVPDSSGGTQSSGSDVPSAWTTTQRLAKEHGRRAFISGRKLILGSAGFAADWSAPGSLRIGWHDSPDGERWLALPTARQTSQGSKGGVTEVTGRVPLNRARFFRPGVSVIVHHTPSVAAGDRRMVCSGISHTLGRDIDGAEITLTDPVDPDPERSQADR